MYREVITISIYSGKCDFYDTLSGQGGWFDKNGNSINFNDPNVRVLYSDEMKDFIAFKEKTKGVIYQYKKVEATKFNIDELIKNNEFLKKIETIYLDKKGKERKKVEYEYFGTIYKTLNKLNKDGGVLFKKEIKFDTLLDLIPYYPYLVSRMFTDRDKKLNVSISTKSYVDEMEDDNLTFRGNISEFNNQYRKELQDHIVEVVNKYYNPNGREFVEEFDIINDKVFINKHLDVYWGIKLVDYDKPYWTNPTIIDEENGIVDFSKVFLYFDENEKQNKVKIKYVIKDIEK